MSSIFEEHPEVARWLLDAESGRNTSIGETVHKAMEAIRLARSHLHNAEFQANMACRDRTRQEIEDAVSILQQVENSLAVTRTTIGQAEEAS